MFDFESGRGERDKLLEKAHKNEVDRALEEMMKKETARQIGELARTGTVLNQELGEEMEPINDAEKQAYEDYVRMIEEKATVADWNKYGRELPN